MASFPSVFISHGPPTLLLEPAPSRDFLAGLGETLGRPDAIVCVSAHWNTETPAISTAENPETIYDFYNFPQRSTKRPIRRPAPRISRGGPPTCCGKAAWTSNLMSAAGSTTAPGFP